MNVWEVISISDAAELKSHLRWGWEPFAVTIEIENRGQYQQVMMRVYHLRLQPSNDQELSNR